ncbi:hypothetical protein [Clostridium perfringens]|uniref:hypothetical protein n=1 Tax=Clostridium perfringens TaxID=1502 RepID=UPI0013D5691F|nr:hypothetical protein [Clostridium perfringens]
MELSEKMIKIIEDEMKIANIKCGNALYRGDIEKYNEYQIKLDTIENLYDKLIIIK